MRITNTTAVVACTTPPLSSFNLSPTPYKFLLLPSSPYTILFIYFQFLKEITNPACDKTIEEPSVQTIKDQVLLTPGLVISYRSFKHGRRSAKAIAEAEYSRAAESLKEDDFRRIVEFTIPRACGNFKVFIKSKPDPWQNNSSISDTEFQNALSKPIHSSIAAPMRAFLQSNAYIA